MPLAPLLPKDSLGAGISLRSASVKAEASSDDPNGSCISELSSRAVIARPLSDLFPLGRFERPLSLGLTLLLKVTFGVSSGRIVKASLLQVGL